MGGPVERPWTLAELGWPTTELLTERARTGHFEWGRALLASLLFDEERTFFLEVWFWYALAEADWDLAGFCLEAGYGLDSLEGSGTLNEAINLMPTRLDAVTWLLDRGADIERSDTYFATPLINACGTRGGLALATLLLDRGANIEANTLVDGDLTALMVAAAGGRLEIVRLLRDRGARKDRRATAYGVYRTAEEFAQAHGHHAVAQFIRQQWSPAPAD